MLRLTLLFCIAFVSALLTGCASGPIYQDAMSKVPPPATGMGRIFFYRSSSLGAALHPDIRLNNEVVGESIPQGFFFVDRPAGSYEASCSTEVERKLLFTLAAGNERFIETQVSMGLFVGHISPKLIDAEKARSDLAGLHYTGTSATTTAVAAVAPASTAVVPVPVMANTAIPQSNIPVPQPTVPVAAATVQPPPMLLAKGQTIELSADRHLLGQPKPAGTLLAVLPAGSSVTLDTQLGNYWFVKTGTQVGWLAADEVN